MNQSQKYAAQWAIATTDVVREQVESGRQPNPTDVQLAQDALRTAAAAGVTGADIDACRSEISQ